MMTTNQLQDELLTNIKKDLSELKFLLNCYSGHWDYEDFIYRFYHQSFKTYSHQTSTLAIVNALKKLSSQPLNGWFLKIIDEGTTQKFDLNKSNNNWLVETRPQLEAFFHAKFMLEMAVKYGELDGCPTTLPSGWAALLYLYNLR